MVPGSVPASCSPQDADSSHLGLPRLGPPAALWLAPSHPWGLRWRLPLSPLPAFPGLLCGLPSPEQQHVSPQQREAGEPLSTPQGSRTLACPRGSAQVTGEQGLGDQDTLGGPGLLALLPRGGSAGPRAVLPADWPCLAHPGPLLQGVCLHPRPHGAQRAQEGLCPLLQPDHHGEPGARALTMGRGARELDQADHLPQRAALQLSGGTGAPSPHILALEVGPGTWAAGWHGWDHLGTLCLL